MRAATSSIQALTGALALALSFPALAGAAPPKLQLPFAKGATWWVNGPHSDNGKSGARNSVDLGPGGSGAATVRAAAGGIAHTGTCGGGKYVTIDHGGGWSTRYWHLGSTAKGIDGKRVSAGKALGKTALVCGNPTQFSHVHFGLFKNGNQHSLDGVSIGGYTAHAGKTQYSGYWTRDKDKAEVHTTGSNGYAHCCLTNNQSTSSATADNPRGHLDKLSSPSAGRVRVAGWAYDPNAKTKSIGIHVYIGGKAGAKGAKGYNLGKASRKRPDVAKAFKGAGPNHGFDSVLKTSRSGSTVVCVYALDVGPGSNVLLSCGTLSVRKAKPPGAGPPGKGDSTGWYDPGPHGWHLRNSLSPGPSDYIFPRGSKLPGQIPVVGDWNGDGRDSTGWYDPGPHGWHLRNS
ncbi:MAG: M23 family metallopeptidase, partial [Solirubrobacterales bacterium]